MAATKSWGERMTISLFDADRLHCRWPIECSGTAGGGSSAAGGEAEALGGEAPGIAMAALLICGVVVRPGSSYCPHHHGIAYISVEQDRRNRAMTTEAPDARRRKGMSWAWKAA